MDLRNRSDGWNGYGSSEYRQFSACHDSDCYVSCLLYFWLLLHDFTK
ncbi:MAG: hypothetical protein ACLU8C_08990 [Lacrimispora saccharolytica]